ncbi:MAG TPA: hypothetical protein VFA26_03375 [Gemmataceae bacterium]|nr:hypothetical protein [Gemmataceae bacterium]
MKTTSSTSGAPRPRGRAPALLAALFAVALFAAPAVAAPTPTFAEGSSLSRSVWAPIQWAMGSQRRMLQTATVGMCLALYIIMWRK